MPWTFHLQPSSQAPKESCSSPVGRAPYRVLSSHVTSPCRRVERKPNQIKEWTKLENKKFHYYNPPRFLDAEETKNFSIIFHPGEIWCISDLVVSSSLGETFSSASKDGILWLRIAVSFTRPEPNVALIEGYRMNHYRCSFSIPIPTSSTHLEREGLVASSVSHLKKKSCSTWEEKSTLMWRRNPAAPGKRNIYAPGSNKSW